MSWKALYRSSRRLLAGHVVVAAFAGALHVRVGSLAVPLVVALGALQSLVLAWENATGPWWPWRQPGPRSSCQPGRPRRGATQHEGQDQRGAGQGNDDKFPHPNSPPRLVFAKTAGANGSRTPLRAGGVECQGGARTVWRALAGVSRLIAAPWCLTVFREIASGRDHFRSDQTGRPVADEDDGQHVHRGGPGRPAARPRPTARRGRRCAPRPRACPESGRGDDLHRPGQLPVAALGARVVDDRMKSARPAPPGGSR